MKKINTIVYQCERTGRKFKTESDARLSENKFTKAMVAKLKRRIASGKYWVPKVGELVYTRTMISIDHGENDVEGGLSLVTKVYRSMSGGDPNCVFIEIAQHDRGGNWPQFLFPEQAGLMKRHGLDVAHADPDYGLGCVGPWTGEVTR